MSTPSIPVTVSGICPPYAAPQLQAEEQPVIHFATCNLCDSRDRYKCADCPNFDTCSNCFSITREQRPHHAFIKLSKASDYIRRGNPVAPMHFVTCNRCKKAIYRIWHKCMHPECPDFDLCDSCEVFPIPVHLDNHPLLKMCSAITVVLTVYRVGQTTLIDPEELQRGRSLAPTPSTHSHSPLFERGYIANPGRSHTMLASFFDSALTPVLLPPSPFFFRSESSRSSSPAMMLPTTVQEFDPLLPSPMMMPGGLYDGPAFPRQPQPVHPMFPPLAVPAAYNVPGDVGSPWWNHFEEVMTTRQEREREEREAAVADRMPVAFGEHEARLV
ncbi:hypothetical protein DFH07DRAFT_974171 [Mycena maculata]|uniref:ZZ-type domain-containing protein n=1 Tax=Mycena maculata TaxID=230809 RepID=A0AAD7MFL1_9AGAR|nr:hypothetical protein DFH07DRAFT_974171 [Mycena maculata]